MDEALLKRVKKYSNHFTIISGIDCCVLNLRERRFNEEPPIYCRDSCPNRCGNCDCFQVHYRSCLEAERWDGRYTYYCPLNLVFVAAFCTTRMGTPTGMVAGPLLIDEFDPDAFPTLNMEQLRQLERVPVLNTTHSYHFGETLGALLTCCGIRDRGFSPTEHRWDIINKMFRFATTGSDMTQTGYSIEMERRLVHFISDGEGAAALQLINQLLSYITFSTGNNIESAKSRCIELLVVMSRAAIDAGSHIDTVFVLNEKYLAETRECTTIEDLGVWLSTAAASYAAQVENSSHGKYSYPISRAISYIRQNYATKITMEETAKMVHLSRSYFCKLFTDETGTSFTNYVIQVRIEKSKPILLENSVKLADVANMVGFIDQSYFTKCFRKTVGISPGKYRNSRGKIEWSDE